jgi:hypothetical protein
VRAAIDEQLQEQAIAVAQAEHIGAALDVPYLQIAFDEVTRHCKNFFGRYADILSSCKSSCNVNSDLSEFLGILVDKKKALEL